MNRPIIAPAAALCAGIVTSEVLKIYWPVWAVFAFVLCAAALALKGKKSSVILLCAFFAAGAALYSYGVIRVPAAGIGSPEFASAGKTITKITGRVMDIPKESDYTAYFIMDVRSAEGAGVVYKGLKGKARVSMRKRMGIALQSGDIIEIRSGFSAPEPPLNPGQFDYGRYLHRKGISALIRCDDSRVIIKGHEPGFFTFAGFLRRTMTDAIYRYVPHREAVVVEGVLTGNERKISEELNEAFRATGTAHILAVSGMNASLVALFMFLGLKIFRVRGRPAAVITIGGVILFALMTGAESSIVRASVMACSALLAVALGRNADVLNALYISCFFMVTTDPAAVFDAGFQLSFLATFGLIYLTPWVIKICRGWPDAVTLTAGTSLAAQLFVSPAIINTFGRLSLISLLANIFIAPLSGFLTITGFMMWIFSWIPPIASVFGAACWAITVVMSYLAELLSRVPYADISVKPLAPFSVLFYYFILIALPHADVDVKLRNISLKTTAGIFLAVSFLFHVLCHDGKFSYYEFRAKGITASFYKTEKNNKVLVLACDGGKKQGDTGYAVVPYLRRLGVNRIDLLMCVEVKNSENIAEITGNFNVKKVMYSGNSTKCYLEKWGSACAGPGFGELDFGKNGRFVTNAWPRKSDEGVKAFVCGR